MKFDNLSCGIFFHEVTKCGKTKWKKNSTSCILRGAGEELDRNSRDPKNMKKQQVPSVGELSRSNTKKHVPNNTGKEYFKWTMTTRNLLLREAQSREPWTVCIKKGPKHGPK